MKVYNTLARRKEEFQPLDPPAVKMYVCGITPYDETHLGHGRAYVTFDLVRRWLEFSGYKVTYVQNITDVDDKIIKKSEILNPKSEIPTFPCGKPGSRSSEASIGTNSKSEIQNSKQRCQEVADKYMKSYFEVMDKLNVKRADRYPKATEHIPEMVRWIGGLVDRGFAYLLDDGVYFEVNKFADYGKLSGRKKEEQAAGARVEVDNRKKNPLDFALWKKAKQGEPSWPSPWGEGRPGWHIECSVMSTKYLGEQFDIHGGGMDLEFPHHENEIAQTESYTGKPWVKYWLHNGFVNVNKQKISKSLGNFFTLKDIFEKYDPMVIRFFLLSTHYRSPINYSDSEIESVKEAWSRLCEFVRDMEFMAQRSNLFAPEIEVKDMEEDLLPFREKFKAEMDDDFNSAGAIAAIFEMVKFCRKTLDEGESERECLAVMKKSVIELCGILGLAIVPGPKSKVSSQEIDKLIAERETARQNKNFKRADEIRKELSAQGIVLEDTAYGTKWKAQA